MNTKKKKKKLSLKIFKIQAVGKRKIKKKYLFIPYYSGIAMIVKRKIASI